jgi:hypothetical protein
MNPLTELSFSLMCGRARRSHEARVAPPCRAFAVLALGTTHRTVFE